MAITPARERVRKSRKRRRLGLRTVQVELSEQAIDFLLARKYELERTDNASIGRAVSWGRPENEGASVTRYGLIFRTFRHAFLRRSQKRGNESRPYRNGRFWA
jgi:hypothetical protein